MTRAMKDSKVEWIGEIPEGWEINRMRFLFRFGKGLSISKSDLIESGAPVISYGQVHSKANRGTHVTEEIIRYVPEGFYETDWASLCGKGSFIFADTSEDLEGCGNAAYIDSDIPIFAGYHSIAARPLLSDDNRFLAYLFLTDAWRDQYRKLLIDVKVYSISQARLKDTTVILPPKPEQKKIADYLDGKCARIDEAIERHRALSERLRDYRKSIIYQAVTGKVDCRREETHAE